MTAQELVLELIAANDVAKVYDAVSAFALLSETDFALACVQLKKAYGKELDASILKRSVKTAQRIARETERGERVPYVQGTRLGVNVTGKDSETLAHELLALLGEHYETAQAPIFYHNGALAYIETREGACKIVPLTEHSLRSRIKRIFAFYCVKTKIDGTTGEYVCEPPKELTHHLYYSADFAFPVLKALSAVPVLRPDGSLWNTPGYDSETHYYYAPMPGVTFGNVPDAPTQGEAQEAAQRVLAALATYAFADATDSVTALAAALTILARNGIDGSIPLFAVDAPTRGSGKTKVLTSIIMLGTGLPLALAKNLQAWPKEETEQEKAIFSVLREGKSYAAIDNVRGVVNSPVLESILTNQGSYRGRILGKSEMLDVSTHAVWLMAGNSMRLAGDLPRRTVFIHLDPKDSHPERKEQSTFRIPDIDAYMSERQGALIVDMLTIARAWYLAKRPKAATLPHLGNYEQWIEVIGSMLAFAGVSHFLTKLDEDMDNADDDAQEWEIFLTQGLRERGDTTWGVRELATYMLSNVQSSMAQALPDYLEKSFDRGPYFKVALGNTLRMRAGRRFGSYGVRVEKAGQDTHNKSVLWRFTSDTPLPDLPKAEKAKAPAPSANGTSGAALLQSLESEV